MNRRKTAGLIVCALGVVFGDIGTSPLYALRECFHGAHGLVPTAPHVLGVLSLVIWTLILIVCLKYVTFVLRADNHGEGGILALFALTRADEGIRRKRRTILVMTGLLGASLLYGDGIITPCITVLGAVEGLNVATPFFEPWIVPLSLAILVAIFSVQRAGTGKVGGVFGPIMLVWFVVIALLGLRGILMAPEVLAAMAEAARAAGRSCGPRTAAARRRSWGAGRWAAVFRVQRSRGCRRRRSPSAGWNRQRGVIASVLLRRRFRPHTHSGSGEGIVAAREPCPVVVAAARTNDVGV